MSTYTQKQLLAERNQRIVAWAAEKLGYEGTKREQFYHEMHLLFDHVTDNELAEYLLQKLSPAQTVTTVEGARKAIQRFHEIARGWLENTSTDRRA